MLIDRFIAKELLICSGLAIMTMSGVLVAGNVFKDAFDLLLNRNVPLLPILRFVACGLPFSLSLAIPWGFLTAVLLVFGRMASDKELFALHSVGISMVRICYPVFLIAFLLSLLCFWINAEIAPRARLEMRNILSAVISSALIGDSAPDQIIRAFPSRRIYIGTQNAGRLGNIQIFELNNDLQVNKFVFAREGRVESNKELEEILIHLRDVSMDERNLQQEQAEDFRRTASARSFVYRVSFYEMSGHSSKYRSLGSYTLHGLRTQIRKLENNLVFRSELNKRLSLSLACVAFALMGVPLAVLAHRRETSIGFGLGLAVGFLYYLGFMMCDNYRYTPSAHPEVLMWGSNLIFLPLGSYLFWRLARC
jgi:lipopolysaccharide export system permease protein